MSIELGYPWENRAAWDRVAPFYKVKDITTPTLFVGGNIDWNVPDPGRRADVPIAEGAGPGDRTGGLSRRIPRVQDASHIKDCTSDTWPGMRTTSKPTALPLVPRRSLWKPSQSELGTRYFHKGVVASDCS